MGKTGKRAICFLLGVVSPGLGHVALGRYKSALGFYSAAIAGALIFSYWAAFGPLAMELAFILAPALLLSSGASAFAASRTTTKLNLISACLAFVAMIVVWAAIQPLRRTATFAQPSDSMSPALIAGDSFVVDMKPRDYEVGDLVVVKDPETKSQFVRQIVRIHPPHVSVTTAQAPSGDEATYESADLKGKVLYIYFSRVPHSFSLRIERFFLLRQ